MPNYRGQQSPIGNDKTSGLVGADRSRRVFHKVPCAITDAVSRHAQKTSLSKPLSKITVGGPHFIFRAGESNA